MGTSGSSQAAVLQSEALPAGASCGRDGRVLHADVGEAGAAPEEPVTDPNAPTAREQVRRAVDRAHAVLPGQDPPTASPTNAPPADGSSMTGEADLGGPRKITLNRRQTRSIRQGVQKALALHARMVNAVRSKPGPWSLMEIFAGRATLSDLARRVGK